MGRGTQLVRSLLLLGVLLAGGLGAVTALEVGEQAPDFLLPATTGGNLTLSRFRGEKLVLLEFYMGDFMPTCAANLSARKADYGKFRELNVQILAISGTSFQTSQQAFANSLDLPFPLLSDRPALQAIRSYGVLHTNPIMARRAFFLIDTQGIVRGRWWGEPFDVFPSEEILKTAQAMTQQR